ncbi:exopolyphosphatase, partial [Amylibacter sp.]|nr:exopolyphosphatase [Amylibacter sp.]
HWRIHPDHRSNFCFESTLLSNLGGLSHEERIFLATCFLHRYKIKSILADRVKINELLNNKQISLAQTIGSAVRLGAMINGSDLEKMGHLSVTSESIILELNVSGKKIFGEVALKRLQSVANSMKLKASINYV